MPSFPIVVEDTSPMLSFSTSAWRAGVSGDSQLDQYSASSYLLTQTDGATISFGFFGSSVQVFGAKRSYHGQYQVQVDDFAPTTLNGTSNAELFNQLLFSTNFSLGNHLLQFTNVNVTFTDLDYISYQTSVGRDDEELIVNTFEDGHPYFTYSPANAWGNPALVSTFIGSTGHATTTAQASANFTFQVCDAVALYGPTGPNSCSSYSIKIDNGNASSFTANRQFYKPQTMLYYAGNLGPGRHTLQIQIPGANSGEFAIDFATVYTTPSLGGSNIVESNSSFGLPTSSPVHLTKASRTQLEKNLIAGLAVVSTALVVVILTSIYVVWRQRRGTSAKSSETTAQKSSGVSPFRSSQRIETPMATADIDQPVVPQSLGNRRGKLAVDIIPVSRVPEAVASSSSTSGAQPSELQSNVDTSVSPPHYTLSPDESLVNSGSTSA